MFLRICPSFWLFGICIVSSDSADSTMGRNIKELDKGVEEGG